MNRRRISRAAGAAGKNPLVLSAAAARSGADPPVRPVRNVGAPLRPGQLRVPGTGADEGHQRLRHSFLSLDRESDPPVMLAGEYGRRGDSTRLAHYEIDTTTGLLVAGDRDRSWPLDLDDHVLS